MVSGEECPRGFLEGRRDAWSRAKSAQEGLRKAAWVHGLGRRVLKSVPRRPYGHIVSGEECPRVSQKNRIGVWSRAKNPPECNQKAVWAGDACPKSVPRRPYGHMISGEECPRGFPEGRRDAWSRAKGAQEVFRKAAWVHGLRRRVLKGVPRRVYGHMVSGEECPRVSQEGRNGDAQEGSRKATCADGLGRRVPKSVPTSAAAASDPNDTAEEKLKTDFSQYFSPHGVSRRP